MPRALHRAATLLLLLALPASAAAELPVQDNEIVFSLAAGAIAFEDPQDARGAQLETRVGATTSLTLGLMNRATAWLDAELHLGLLLLIAGDEGFTQESPAGERARPVLPGVLLRALLRARLIPSAKLSPTFGLGLTAAIVASPAIGAFTRVELEATLGYELIRTSEVHLNLELGYAFPAIDGLCDEPGVDHTSPLHRAFARVGVGF